MMSLKAAFFSMLFYEGVVEPDNVHDVEQQCGSMFFQYENEPFVVHVEKLETTTADEFNKEIINKKEN